MHRIAGGETMAGMVFLGAMAAFGVLSLLWAVLGWLLPGGKGGAVVCFGVPDPWLRIRVQWLQSLGLLRFPLIVVTEQRPQEDTMEYCSPGRLLARLEQERTFFHGTGNGDSSGDHRSGGLPEL